MKTQLIQFATVLVTTTASLGFAQAAVNLTEYEQRIPQILQLESNGQIKSAVMLSMQSSLDLANQMGLDKTVASVTSTLNEIQQEVVTQRNSVSGGFNFLGLFRGKAEGSWDVAKMVLQNPAEVANFGRQVRQDYAKLQGQVLTYIRANEVTLVYTKAFAAKALQLSAKLSIEDRQELAAMISRTAQLSQRFTFSGVQSIQQCVTTHYAERSKKGSAGISLLFFSMNVGGSQSRPAYSTQSCIQREQSTSASENAIFSAKLYEADMFINAYEKALGLKNLSDAQADYYPTWGSPSFQ